MARIRIGELPLSPFPSPEYEVPVEKGGITERIPVGLLLSLLSGDAPEEFDTLEKLALSKANLTQVVRHDVVQSLTLEVRRQARRNIGALVSGVAAKSADYTIVPADAAVLICMDASAGNRTVTLPSLASVGDGFSVVIEKIDTSYNTVTIAGTVGGVTNKVLRLPGQATVLVSDNTSGTWRIIAEAGTLLRAADKSWERRADGWQICRTTVSITPVANTPTSVTWNYPMLFSDVPEIAATAHTLATTFQYAACSVKSAAAADICILRTNTTVTSASVVAEGPWF